MQTFKNVLLNRVHKNFSHVANLYCLNSIYTGADRCRQAKPSLIEYMLEMDRIQKKGRLIASNNITLYIHELKWKNYANNNDFVDMYVYAYDVSSLKTTDNKVNIG